MADDIGWEAVTLKGELAHRASLISISLSGQPSLCDNARKSRVSVPKRSRALQLGTVLNTGESR